MRLAACLIAGLFVVPILAGPVDGPKEYLEHPVPASKPNEPGEMEMTIEFKGGERASIIVLGDHKPPADLEIRVYELDAKGMRGSWSRAMAGRASRIASASSGSRRERARTGS